MLEIIACNIMDEKIKGLTVGFFGDKQIEVNVKYD